MFEKSLRFFFAPEGAGASTEAGSEPAQDSDVETNEPLETEPQEPVKEEKIVRPQDDDEPKQDDEPKPGAKQASSVFASLYEEEFGKEENPQEEFPEGVKPESRAAKTIIDLRSRAQKAEQEATNFQTVMQQREQELGTYLSKMQQDMQTLREENAAMKARYEVLSRHGGSKEEENPYISDLLKRFDTDVLSQRLDPVQKQIQSIAEENKKLRQDLAKREELEERKQRAQQIRMAAHMHYYDSVMRGVPKEQSEELSGLGATLVMAMQRALGSDDPTVASAKLRQFILKSADIISRNAKTTTKESINKGKEAGTVASRSGVGGKVKEPIPTQEQLVADGRFMTPWEYIEAGRPKLRNQSAKH